MYQHMYGGDLMAHSFLLSRGLCLPFMGLSWSSNATGGFARLADFD